MIDLHSHILPGLDDGPATIDGSLEIARRAAADGVRVLAATPHVRRDYPTDPARMEQLVEQLRSALAREGIPITLRPGGEVAIDWLEHLSAADLRRFGLGGSPRFLLVECPYTGWPRLLARWVPRLVARGMTPVLAHPERNEEVQRDPERLSELIDAGALVQVTAGSLDGRLGRLARSTGLDLVRHGLAHLVASDAHEASIREIGMSSAAGAVGDRKLSRWLTYDVPAAIVTDAPLPPRPKPANGRAWLFRR